MSLDEIKQGLGQRGIEKEKSETTPIPSPKKETTVFDNNEGLTGGEVREIIKHDTNKLFSKYQTRGVDARELAQKLTNEKKFGSLTEPKEVKGLKKQLEG